MRVKKFEAKSMKEALQMVKKELGPDAVILAARDNRKSYGIGGEASVEITAAVSEATLQKKRFTESRMTTTDQARFAKSDARTQRHVIEQIVSSRIRAEQPPAPPAAKRPITRMSYIDIPDEELARTPSPRRSAAYERATGRNVAELLSDFEQDFNEREEWQQKPAREAVRHVPLQTSPQQRQVAKPTQAVPRLESNAGAPPTQPGDRAFERIRNAAREAWSTNPFSEEASKARAVGIERRQASSGGLEMVTPAFENKEVEALKGEISRLHQVLEGFQKVPQTFTTMHPGADYGLPYDLSFMFQKLCEAGITIDNAVDILKTAAQQIDPVQIKKRPLVDAWVARWLLNSIQIVQTPFAGRVHLFVGGAGSGKTSSLVKMASQLVVKERKKIAILTTDSFKVGAVDQLKIYCQILNVPFAVLRNRKDWDWILGQLQHVDHVLVDFPGFQLRDLDEIHLLKGLLPPEGLAPITHLCVSATSKDGDAYEMAKRYKVTDFQDLIFTNLDQSVQHGIIHNLQKKTAKPLHSFGIGNRVPEDFEVASKERVLDLIFKLTKLRREST